MPDPVDGTAIRERKVYICPDHGETRMVSGNAGSGPVHAIPECGRPVRVWRLDGAELIAAERQRQIDAEGWTSEHDDEHAMGEMSRAAACYADKDRGTTLVTIDAPTIKFRSVPFDWPWDPKWWKPTPEDRVRELVKAGALIAAEIDRLQRRSDG